MGGGECTDAENILYSGGAGGAYKWGVDIDNVPTHQEDCGRVPPSGGTETERSDSMVEPVQDVDMPFHGGSDVIYGSVGGGY